MKNYGFYIRETTSGLTASYISDDLEIPIEDKNRLDEDERMHSTQFASNSLYFFIQITQNLKVYVIINSKISDSAGSDGYRAIYLISKDKYSTIGNFRDILEKAETRYQLYRDSGKSTSLDLDNLLAELQVNRISFSNFHPIQEKRKFYFLFNKDNPSTIDDLFNSRDSYVIDKLYAFEQNSVLDKQTGVALKLYEFIPGITKVSQIIFDYGYLKKIEVGTEVLTTFGSSPITLLYPKSLTPIAYVGNKSEPKPITESVTKFIRPKPKTPPPPSQPPVGIDRIKLAAAGLGILIVMAIGTLYVFDLPPFQKDIIPPQIQTTQNTSDSLKAEAMHSPKAPEKAFIRDTISSKQNIYYYTLEIPSIKEWTFTFVEPKWIYYKSFADFGGNRNKQELNGSKINDFLSSNYIKPEDWNRFADSLEVKSKQKVPKFLEVPSSQEKSNPKDNKPPKNSEKSEKEQDKIGDFKPNPDL